jgi:hypothetical protein
MDRETLRNTSTRKNSRCPDKDSNRAPCNNNSEANLVGSVLILPSFIPFQYSSEIQADPKVAIHFLDHPVQQPSAVDDGDVLASEPGLDF